MPFRKPGVAIATLALAIAPFSAQAAGTEREDAQCLMVYSMALGQYEQSEDRDYTVATGLYAIIGYFSGKLTAQAGVDRLRSIMNKELAAEVAEDQEAIQKRCTAEAEKMAKAMSAAADAHPAQ